MTAPFQRTRADAAKVLNALAQPLFAVDAQGMVIEVNIAAETFFDMGRGALLRTRLTDLLPFGSPVLDSCRRSAQQPRDRQRLQDRHLDAAHRQPGRCRCFHRAAAATERGGGDHAAGTSNCRKNGQATDPSQRRALGHRARRHAGPRDQEPALRHSRRRATARSQRQRRGPRAHPADLRRDRPDRQTGRSDAVLLRFRRRRNRKASTSTPCSIT